MSLIFITAPIKEKKINHIIREFFQLNLLPYNQGPGAGALLSRVFLGAGALNFPMLQDSFLFFNILIKLFFLIINIQYFNYSRKNE